MILIISTCSDPLSELEFVRPIQQLTRGVVKHYSQVSEEDLERADRIIIAGTALKDFDYLEGQWDWLQNTGKSVLGICAGMQVIAQAFNVELEDFVTIGPKQVVVKKENMLVTGEFNAYFLHTKTGVGNFDVLAESEGKPCMIKHPKKEIYGCIFHPEVMNEQLITAFCK